MLWVSSSRDIPTFRLIIIKEINAMGSNEKKKDDKTKAAKTPKEKKQAKREKKGKKDNPSLFDATHQ